MVPPRSEVLTLGECLPPPLARVLKRSQRVACARGMSLRFTHSIPCSYLGLRSPQCFQPWITPSVFDGTNNPDVVDEWTFCQYVVSLHTCGWSHKQDSRYQAYDTAHSTLVNHWNTWITQSDFQTIKNAGLNHVRIPIGYWAYDISRGLC